MSILTGVVATPIDQKSGLWAGLPQWIIRAAVRALYRYRTRRALAQLSDHMLKDIGVRRCEINSIAQVVAEGGWDDTRVHRSANVHS